MKRVFPKFLIALCLGLLVLLPITDFLWQTYGSIDWRFAPNNQAIAASLQTENNRLEPQELSTDRNLPSLNHLLSKPKVKIVVVDFGLGNLSITANLAQRLKKERVFESVQLIALSLGSDSISELTESFDRGNSTVPVEITKELDRNLAAIASQYQPDLLLIASHTLSLLYKKTKFIQNPLFPVIDILDTGVKTIAQYLDEFPDNTVVALGSGITTTSHTYSKNLKDFGYNQIIEQQCTRLGFLVERDYMSSEMAKALNNCIGQVLDRLQSTNTPIAISFNCTNLGYITEQFQSKFVDLGYSNIKILNPNSNMTDVLFASNDLHRYTETKVTVKVISTHRIGSIFASSLALVSPDTAAAVLDYRFEPTMFQKE